MNLQERIDASKHRAIAYASFLEFVKAFQEKGDEVTFCSLASIARLELREGLKVDKYKRASEQKVLDMAREVDETLSRVILRPGLLALYFQYLVEAAMDVETEYISELVGEKEQS